MIDSVSLYLNDPGVLQHFSFEKIFSVKLQMKPETGEFLGSSGYIENLVIKNTSRGILISGSLPKYFYGNNLQSLSVQQIKYSILELSDILDLDLKDALVYRLDIGYNFIMDDQVTRYFMCLGDLPHYRKSIYNFETVQYSTHKKSLIFYNKMLEALKKGSPIPPEFVDYNNRVLRYELQFRRHLSKEFGFNESITAGSLSDPDFLNVALTKWKQHYFAIKKVNPQMLDIDFTKGNKNLIKSLALAGLNSLGYDAVLQMIRSQRSELTKQMYWKLKRSVRDLLSVDAGAVLNYSQELDSKINSIEIV